MRYRPVGEHCARLLDRIPDALLDVLPVLRCGGPHSSRFLLCALQFRRQALRRRKKPIVLEMFPPNLI